jgi:hypothetical protein
VKRQGIAVILCFGLTLCVRAQSSIEDRAAALKKALQTPSVNWDDTFVEKTYQSLVDMYVHDLLWDPDFRKKVGKRLPRYPPKVMVQATSELRTPYESGGAIVLPLSYMGFIGNISQLVGHDVYGSDNFIQTPRPLLSTPFRVSSVMPLLQPLYQYVDYKGFASIAPYVKCPTADADCAAVQGAAFTSLIAFLLIHEMTHEMRGDHVSAEGLNLEQELNADENAYAVVTMLSGEMKYGRSEDVNKSIQQVMRLAPILWLNVESSRKDLADVIAMERARSLMKTLAKEDKDELDELSDADLKQSSMLKLTITWDELPTTLMIDGIQTLPSVVVGRSLLVTPTSHVIVALRAGALALVRTHSDRSRVSLAFKPLLPGDLEQIKRARTELDWAGVLLRTSDDSLKPKTSEVSPYHWEALHNLGLDCLIAIEDWNAIPVANRRSYQRWQLQGQVLTQWYLGAGVN